MPRKRTGPYRSQNAMRKAALRGFYTPKPQAPPPGAAATTSPTTAPASAPQQSGGGGNPYSGVLSEFLNSSKARFAADSAADAASRDAALRRYVISYGQVPDFDKLGISDQTRGFLQGAINDKARALAEQNTKEGTSIYARTKAANDKANRLIPATLASRGMLFSGQTGADTREQAQNYKIQNFDQLNEMLGGIEGSVGSFLQAERARADALAQAELQAQMSAFDNYGGDVYGDDPVTAAAQAVANAGKPGRAGKPFVYKPPKPSFSFVMPGKKKKRVYGNTVRRLSGQRTGGV